MHMSPPQLIILVHPRAGAERDITPPFTTPTQHVTDAWPLAEAVPEVTNMKRLRTLELFCRYSLRLLLLARRGWAPADMKMMGLLKAQRTLSQMRMG